MLWANDRIRLQFYGAFMGKPLLGKVLDEMKNVDYGTEFDIKNNPDLEITDLISFNKSAAFNQMY